MGRKLKTVRVQYSWQTDSDRFISFCLVLIPLLSLIMYWILDTDTGEKWFMNPIYL